jgi:toxin-antitoxin system PIN domain toxin
MNSYLVDANVWLAICHDSHVHHRIALRWLHESKQRSFFCRLTQLALLRLLTNRHVMGEGVRNHAGAWLIYDQLRGLEGVGYIDEPSDFESFFRESSRSGGHSPNAWSDAYLAALALNLDLRLVSFDRVFRSISNIDALVLG